MEIKRKRFDFFFPFVVVVTCKDVFGDVMPSCVIFFRSLNNEFTKNCYEMLKFCFLSNSCHNAQIWFGICFVVGRP